MYYNSMMFKKKHFKSMQQSPLHSSISDVQLHLLLQGVPIRLELGPKDMENQSVMLARRDTGAKESVAWGDVTTRVPELLEQIQVATRACLYL